MDYPLYVTMCNEEMTWGSGGMAPRILNFAPKWRWVLCFICWPLSLPDWLRPSQGWLQKCFPLPGTEPRLSNQKPSHHTA